jgi:hypothetical protein
MGSKRSKAPDEIFCRSCGTAIKKEAEICPDCGVRNNNQSSQSRTSRNSGSSQSTGHNPANYETNVGSSWYYLVAIPPLLTIPSLAIFAIDFSRSLFFLTLVGALLFLTAVVAPMIGVWFDRKYVQANSEWNPSILWEVGFFFLYFMNIVLAVAYLYQRHKAVREPEWPPFVSTFT